MDMNEAQAQVEAWKYAHGFNEMRVLKMVVELGIAEALESRGGPMTLFELSSAVGCPEPALYRILRYLNHKGIVKRQINSITSAVTYAPTLVSGFLTGENLGSYVLVQSGPDIDISTKDLKSGRGSGLNSGSTDDKIWTAEIDEEYRNILHKFLECHSRATALALIKNAPETFQQIGSLVDIGGRVGTALGILVKAFPWITGTNFDLQDVISQAPPVEGVVHVGGDMFKSVPTADAIMLMWILHDWGDRACIDILKKCREAISMDTGKVIIVEAIVDDDDEEEERDELCGARLALDMTIMVATSNGKERTAKEWEALIDAAGFTRHSIKHMKGAIESVIEAYP